LVLPTNLKSIINLQILNKMELKKIKNELIFIRESMIQLDEKIEGCAIRKDIYYMTRLIHSIDEKINEKSRHNLNAFIAFWILAFCVYFINTHSHSR